MDDIDYDSLGAVWSGVVWCGVVWCVCVVFVLCACACSVCVYAVWCVLVPVCSLEYVCKCGHVYVYVGVFVTLHSEDEFGPVSHHGGPTPPPFRVATVAPGVGGSESTLPPPPPPPAEDNTIVVNSFDSGGVC